MAQKKAFVRYANNKAVPGSLIVRTKAPKVGTWKEVPYDVCCNPVLNVGYSFQPSDGVISLNKLLGIYCNTEFNTIFLLRISDVVQSNTTPQEAVDYLNSTYSWVGTWSWFVDPNDPGLIVINVAISQPLLDVLNLACPGGTIGYIPTN